MNEHIATSALFLLQVNHRPSKLTDSITLSKIAAVNEHVAAAKIGTLNPLTLQPGLFVTFCSVSEIANEGKISYWISDKSCPRSTTLAIGISE